MPTGLRPNATFRQNTRLVQENNSPLVLKTKRAFIELAERYRPIAREPFKNHYWLDISIKRMEKVIRQSKIFNLDFQENEIFATVVRKGLAGLDDLDKLMIGIETLDVEEGYDYQQNVRAALKNFSEGYAQWLRTALDFSGPPEDWIPVSKKENSKLAELRSMSKKERKEYWNEL